MQSIINEKYGKYLFKCLLNKKTFLFIWGINLGNDEEYLLMDENNKLLFFNDFSSIKKYVNDNSSMKELVQWANKFKDENVKSISLNIYKELKHIDKLSYKDILLWEEISLLIELYDDIIYIKNECQNEKTNEIIDLFKEQYNDNFIWKNKKKEEFKIDKEFIKNLKSISKYLKKNIIIVEGNTTG